MLCCNCSTRLQGTSTGLGRHTLSECHAPACALCVVVWLRIAGPAVLSFLLLRVAAPVSTPQACEAAEYLTKLPDRIRKLSERAAARKQKTKGTKANFSWVFDRPVELV